MHKFVFLNRLFNHACFGLSEFLILIFIVKNNIVFPISHVCFLQAEWHRILRWIPSNIFVYPNGASITSLLSLQFFKAFIEWILEVVKESPWFFFSAGCHKEAGTSFICIKSSNSVSTTKTEKKFMLKRKILPFNNSL